MTLVQPLLRSLPRGVIFPIAVYLGFAQLLSAARMEGPDREIARDAARRHYLVQHMRIAAADRLIEQPDEIAAYLGAQFNTLVLYDTEDDGGSLKSTERIAFEVAFARAHRLHILLGKATEPLAAPVAGKNAALGVSRALRTAATPQASDEEIRERLGLWDRYGHNVILGVFFLHDDACLIRASVERQLHLYAMAHDTVPDWYVFGMIGEFCYGPPAEEVARYFDPNAFDHLIVLMYPLNLGEVTGTRLDSATSVDPDDDIRRYVQGYLERMGEKFISHLRPGQLAVLVIQVFAYYGEPAGHVPRPADIDIQATAGNEAVRAIAGQAGNRSVAYFLWDGSRAGMFGLWQRPDWMAAAEKVNRRSEDGASSADRKAP